MFAVNNENLTRSHKDTELFVFLCVFVALCEPIYPSEGYLVHLLCAIDALTYGR